MRRKILVLVTTVMLLISMISGTSFAGNGTSFSTTTRQKIGQLTNSSGTNQTAYVIILPGPTSPATVLQLCSANGATVYESDTYLPYPPNTHRITKTIAPGITVSFYVKPVTSGTYVWGTGEYGFQ